MNQSDRINNQEGDEETLDNNRVNRNDRLRIRCRLVFRAMVEGK